MFWMLCIFVSESLLLSRPKSKHRVSVCHGAAAGGQFYQAWAYQESTTISSQKSSWAKNVDTRNQYKGPPRLSPFLKSSWCLHAGKNCQLLFKRTGFKWDATPDHSRYVVKPLKAKTIQFRFRRSLFWMCLRRGRDRDKSDTVNCCSHNLTTSSKPVPNSVWLFRQQGGGLFL